MTSETVLAEWLADHQGESFEGSSRTLTEADLINFAGVSGDFAPIHTNEEYAKQTRYGTRITHGLLTLSIVTTLMSTERPFRGLASYGYDNMRFVGVVLPGDTVSTSGEILDARTKGDGLAVVTVRYTAATQAGDVVLVCDHLLLCEIAVLVDGGKS